MQVATRPTALSEPAPEAYSDAVKPALSPGEPQEEASTPEVDLVAVAADAPPVKPQERNDCVAVSKVQDRDEDFERNLEALAAAGMCIELESFRERSRPWTIQTVHSGRPGPLWAVMHDDEDLSFDIAVGALRTYGGTLVSIDTGGKRNQDGVDPNRNFSDDEFYCSRLGKSATPKFTAAFRQLFANARPIIALHNNVDGPGPTGGLGHVSLQPAPKGMEVTRAKDEESPLADELTLVLLAAADASAESVKSRVSTLSGRGIHVVVEPVPEERGDCSLSNLAVLSGHPDYFNVTVAQDGADKQRRIIDAIMASFATVSASR
jgi:hypothetical protein